MLRILCLMLALTATLGGCVYYEPVPAYPGASNYDRAWNASYGAARDVGVEITSSDPATGIIRGSKDGIDVNISVVRQPDRSVRVQFDARGATERDPGLSNRFSQAYDRRMGR